MKLYYIIFLIGVLIAKIEIVESCEQFQCASIISKCMLNQSCKCDWSNGADATCYSDCIRCLGHKQFMECCSCVGICPSKQQKQFPMLQNSVVEEFDGAVPALFQEFIPLRLNWKVVSFRMDTKNNNTLNSLSSSRTAEKTDIKDKKDQNSTKCSVIFLNKCMALNKCSNFCRSTGASSYRWFHSGCCECIGSNCPVHGLKKNRCRFCPKENDSGGLQQNSLMTVDPFSNNDI